MFIGFVNFYQRFIRGFSKIVVLSISLLKTTGSSNLGLKVFKADDNEVVGGGGDRANKTIVNLFKNNKSRNLIHMPNIGATRKHNFLTSDIKKALNHLWLAFIKALILQYFDLESHIRIKTKVSSYTIDRVLNQLNLDSNPLSNDFVMPWSRDSYMIPISSHPLLLTEPL